MGGARGRGEGHKQVELPHHCCLGDGVECLLWLHYYDTRCEG